MKASQPRRVVFTSEVAGAAPQRGAGVLSRRQALACAASVMLLASCSRKLRCDDVHGLSDSDKAQRRSSGYVDATRDPTQRCAGCDHFRTGLFACGACVVVKGPVNPGGHCDNWTPKRS